MANNPPTEEHKRQFMARAVEEARRARGMTSPNPMVGAVIVKNGEIVASGFHRASGQLHAEMEALNVVGEHAVGLEMYVTLEPCCHWGKQPPCVEALIRSGIQHVYIGSVDPNPQVNGGGIKQLRAGGVEVETGVLAEVCDALVAPFMKWVTGGLPYVIAKYAMTLDGKIASETGDSRWISGPESRRFVHQLRHECDAVIVGRNTLFTDDPRLTTRNIVGGLDPIRVVLDPRGEMTREARVLTCESEAPTWVVCLSQYRETLSKRLGKQAEVIAIEGDDSGRIDLLNLLNFLGDRQVVSVLVEGGGELLSSLLQARQIDEVVAFIAPKLLGGKSAPTPMDGVGFNEVSACRVLKEVKQERLGDDVMIRGKIDWLQLD
jgi:diaminohydroxyphosphoribosylaminopyrimidine deaminase/5-amino-6-(5-phosphoribosylamino)uracil reductase